MRKKLLSLTLALVMCLGLAVPVMAAETQTDGFKHTTLSMLKNDFTFEGGIVRVDSSVDEGRLIKNGAITTIKTWNWSPNTIYIPRGTKVSLSPSFIEEGYKMLVHKGNYVIQDNVNSYQFDKLDTFEIGAYLYEEHLKDDSNYAMPYYVKIAVVDEPAAKLKTPFLDIGYFDEQYKREDQYGKQYLVGFSPALREDVEWAYEQGITKGTSATTFSPFDSVRRSQMIQMLWIYSGKPEPRTATHFDDVEATAWYYKALCWADEIGLIQELFPVGTGSILRRTPEGKFCPNWLIENDIAIDALNFLHHQQMPDAIQDGQIRTFGSCCQRVNFCHYLHYAHQLASGTLAN